ncbi:MAG: UbiA family prenyltransferase [Chloroflexi bacterium]|nr:UbiA family prenyltransferase [Chloroflexota bacterium]
MRRQLREFLEMIKFEHTIFVLPFAYLGMVLAAGRWPSWWIFIWVTVAMASARTLAMAANRLIDRFIDARNPRTADRALPQHRITPLTVVAIGAVSLLIFELAAAALNPLALALSPAAVAFLVGYPYAKRYTWLSHWILGFTDGMAVVGGWVAVTAWLELPAWLLWMAVTFWIAGFDLIYACQDVAFDQAEGLYSVPACFGVKVALDLARICHGITLLSLAAVGIVMHLNPVYWVGLAGALALLVYEHSLVSPTDLSRVDMAFFNVNGYISVLIFVTTLIAVLIG